jgi:hypothetical protein
MTSEKIPWYNDKSTSVLDFVTYWINKFDSGRYNERIYSQHITNLPLTEKDIWELYFWKNGTGRKLSKGKTSSIKNKILPFLTEINQYKKQKCTDFDLLHKQFMHISAIWQIFLMHIINPERFPIFDQHVYRAMYYCINESIREIPNYDEGKLIYYKDVYIDFYHGLKRKGIDGRELDQALWSFGKFLKNK